MAEVLDFEEEYLGDGWIKLKLSDGTILKVKPEISGVVRLNQYDRFGNPVYAVSTQTVIRLVHIPKELRRPVEIKKKPDVYG